MEKTKLVENFIRKLKKGDITQSTLLAKETASLFYSIVSGNWWNNLDQLLEQTRNLGKNLIAIDKMQFTLGNTVKRVLFIIREAINEYNSQMEAVAEENKKELKMRRLMRMNSISQIINISSTDLSVYREASFENNEFTPFKNKILTQINAIIEDLENMKDQIVEMANENVNNGDVLLTVNYSKLLESFLLEVAKERKFKLYVAESAPSYKSEALVKKLKDVGIEVVMIEDAAVLAVMPKISKVIIGTRAIMANGGLVSYNGVFNVCLAAKTLSVPVMVVSGTFKLSPQYPFDQETFNEITSPNSIIQANQLKGDFPSINFYSPLYDYVPPDFITIYITNHSIQNPAYIYRLFSELYSQEDYFL